MQPLISIILPTYNGSRYLRRSIESCLSQSFSNIELIVVDDCSTDDTAGIIEQYALADSRIRVIRNEVNRALPASLNKGFAVARGEFFTWTSDDNLFSDTALQTLLDNIRGADIIYSSYHVIDESGRRMDKFSGTPEEILFKCVVGACFLYKRTVHEQLGGYDETKFRMEDMDFWLRAFPKFKASFIDIPDLYAYRKHNNSLTTAIYSDVDKYDKYRRNHFESFKTFFNKGLRANLSDEEINLHIELYFEDIVKNKTWDFDITERLLKYIKLLTKLLRLDWGSIGLDNTLVEKIIEDKRDRMISLVVNDLIFDNKVLLKENPKLARNLNKPISWYYKEYEVLPLWFKRVGHIIKVLQNNRSWRSIFTNHPNP
jgi:glycosyltransferase involved in cell wall biosynthesis